MLSFNKKTCNKEREILSMSLLDPLIRGSGSSTHDSSKGPTEATRSRVAQRWGMNDFQPSSSSPWTYMNIYIYMNDNIKHNLRYNWWLIIIRGIFFHSPTNICYPAFSLSLLNIKIKKSLVSVEVRLWRRSIDVVSRWYSPSSRPPRWTRSTISSFCRYPPPANSNRTSQC